MPYIKDYQKKRIDDGGTPQDCGELNYKLSKLILNKDIDNDEFTWEAVKAFTFYIKKTGKRYKV